MSDQMNGMRQRDDTGRGYRTCALSRPADYGSKTPELIRPDHITFLDDDRYFAAAQGDQVWLFSYQDLLDHGDAVQPLAVFETPAPVRHLVAWPRRGAAELVVALADDSLWAIKAAHTGYEEQVARSLVENLGGVARHAIAARHRLLVVVEDRECAALTLVEVDAVRNRVTRRARLPLDRLTSIAVLDPDKADLLVAVDARHGASLIGFPSDQDGDALTITPFDPGVRATAAAVVDTGWMTVARKGGELIQLATTGAQPAEICRRLRELMRKCGCSCCETRPEKPCDCDDGDGRPGGGRPEDGRPGGGGPGPGGGLPDDEPCQQRRRAHLTWTVAAVQKIGRHLAALSERSDRLAVLDHQLNVVFERYLGRRGALIALGASTDRMLIVRRGAARIEAWSLDEFARGMRGLDPESRLPHRVPDARHAKTVTFRGRRSQPSTPNPHLRVAVFTVTEPGQSFNDPDQSRMQALLQPNVYDVCIDYYRENSFETLVTEFSVFGVHLGTPRRPLVLPRAIASYFYDDFRPGGIEAVVPGDWTNPLVLDGTEAMTLRTAPAAGVGKDYPVRFAAAWTSRTHNTYPVAVNFTGTETLRLDVVDQTGTARTLTLDFAPLNVSHAQGDDETAFLQAIGLHVTNAVRAAEAAVGAPQVLQDVVFRRIRSNDDDTQFGRLQAQLRVAPAAAATQKGRVTITPPTAPAAGLVALGLTDPNPQDGVLGSAVQISGYLAECLHATRFDAGEGAGLNDPHLATSVVTTEDATAMQVRTRIELTTEKGGAGAQITLVSSSGLAGSGWSTATPVPGSDSASNNRNTMRDHQELADDVFTAAMDHIRVTGTWDADTVRDQFDDFDAMMIGFVGACPTTVPAADRWNAVNPADFGRLRMFVRYHQATDLHNPDPNQPPVTMGTDLLIGQRFDRFDPGVMSHEIGHGLALPDLYSASGFRDDVAYVDRWCQMAGGNSRFNHFCAWSKWSVGWIEESADPSRNRVIDVAMPAPSGTTTTEAWLVPIEHWDTTMRADVVAEVGSGLPIGQMMKVHLGSTAAWSTWSSCGHAGPATPSSCRRRRRHRDQRAPTRHRPPLGGQRAVSTRRPLAQRRQRANRSRRQLGFRGGQGIPGQGLSGRDRGPAHYPRRNSPDLPCESRPRRRCVYRSALPGQRALVAQPRHLGRLARRQPGSRDTARVSGRDTDRPGLDGPLPGQRGGAALPRRAPTQCRQCARRGREGALVHLRSARGWR